jgi:hypothetical protein
MHMRMHMRVRSLLCHSCSAFPLLHACLCCCRVMGQEAADIRCCRMVA